MSVNVIPQNISKAPTIFLAFPTGVAFVHKLVQLATVTALATFASKTILATFAASTVVDREQIEVFSTALAGTHSVMGWVRT